MALCHLFGCVRLLTRSCLILQGLLPSTQAQAYTLFFFLNSEIIFFSYRCRAFPATFISSVFRWFQMPTCIPLSRYLWWQGYLQKFRLLFMDVFLCTVRMLSVRPSFDEYFISIDLSSAHIEMWNQVLELFKWRRVNIPFGLQTALSKLWVYNIVLRSLSSILQPLGSTHHCFHESTLPR